MRVSVRRADEPVAAVACPLAASVDAERRACRRRRRRRRRARRVADGRRLLPRAAARGARRSSRSATPSSPGQTLCILEAMKLFNELKAEHDGVVRAIHVENAQPVEFGAAPVRARAGRRAARGLGPSRVRPRPRREPRRDRRPRDPRAARARDRGGRRLLDRRPRRAPRAARRPAPSASARRRPPRATCGSRTSSPRPRRRAARPSIPATASSPRTPRSCARATDNDLVFVGPTADVMEQMGDKVRAKEEMRAAGVPLVPGTDGADGARQARVGRPRMPASPSCSRRRPAAAGRACGSSLGRTSSRTRSRAASAEAEAAFGDGALYLEKARRARAARRDPGALRRGTAACSRSASASARSSAATRSSSRSRRRRRSTRRRARRWRRRSRARLRGDRLPQRGHVRVPARPGRRVLLHRGELPAPGRASGDRARHRDRHRARAAPDRRRASRSPSTGRAPRRGHAIEIRINAEDPARGFAAGAGTVDAVPAAARPGRARRHARRGGHGDPAVLRLADREADRLGRRRATRRSRAPCGRCASSRSRASRRRASSRSTCSRSTEFRGGDYSTSTLAELEGTLPSLAGRMTRSTSRKAARRAGALPPLPVGSHRAAARVAVRGRARRLRALAGRGGRRARAGARRADLRGVAGLAGRPARHARAQHPAHRRVRARGGDGAARGRDQRGGRAREALRDRGRGAARQRHPRPASRARRKRRERRRRRARRARRSSSERLNERREDLERLAAADDVDGDAAVDLIAELAELAKADRGRADAGAQPADAPG